MFRLFWCLLDLIRTPPMLQARAYTATSGGLALTILLMLFMRQASADDRSKMYKFGNKCQNCGIS